MPLLPNSSTFFYVLYFSNPPGYNTDPCGRYSIVPKNKPLWKKFCTITFRNVQYFKVEEPCGALFGFSKALHRDLYA